MDLGKLQGPLLVFGGPYSNLAATQAMQKVAEHMGLLPQQVICTGDVVAYCAEPAETVALIRDWGIHVVMGNCEESLAAGSPDCGCGFSQESACSLLSVEWYRYASEHVSEADKQWMGQLPRAISFELDNRQYQVVHGSVERINEFIFASSCAEHKQQQVALSGADVVIGGHCGVPFGQRLDKGYWLNSGVIGMPANDATDSGWYMLLTPKDETIEVSWQRLPYAHEQSISAMEQQNLCAVYAECLHTGLWPSLDVLPQTEKQQQGLPLDLPSLVIV